MGVRLSPTAPIYRRSTMDEKTKIQYDKAMESVEKGLCFICRSNIADVGGQLYCPVHGYIYGDNSTIIDETYYNELLLSKVK